MLTINREKVVQLIDQARMFDAKEELSDPESGSNSTDDGMVDILEDIAGDATYDELMEFVRGLDEDEQVELVALAWVGRGTYDVSEWSAAVTEARRAHNKRTAEYLTSLPKLGDYLEEGLSAIEGAEEVEDQNQES
jgi:hypothetical protein